jgi:hypothetical protein
MTLRMEVAPVLREAATQGGISRGEVSRLISMGGRSGRDILKGLLDEGLLISDSYRQLRGFPDPNPTQSGDKESEVLQPPNVNAMKEYRRKNALRTYRQIAPK